VSTPFVFVTGFGTARDAVTAMRLGARDFVDKPIFEQDLLQLVGRVLTVSSAAGEPSGLAEHVVAHAAVRWAQAVVPVIDSPKDPRTIGGWSRWIAASPGAIRNWCRTARIPPRRSLVFARLLRAVALSELEPQRPENLLDVVDFRTLVALVKFAGFDGVHALPTRVSEFLDRQALVRDRETLEAVMQVLNDRRGNTIA
jgi:hypothetical protein